MQLTHRVAVVTGAGSGIGKAAALLFARVCPGAIETEIQDNTSRRHPEKVKIPVEYPQGNIPLTGGKPGKAEQVAQLALFLATGASSYLTGTEVWIDGAESLLMG